MAALSALFLFSAVFDMGRLIHPYGKVELHPKLFEATGKSLARYRAYRILEDLKSREGPGWILGEWDVPADRTLEVATHFFDATQIPAPSAGVKWLAVVTDGHFRPFLQGRFPGARWQMLDADLHPEDPRLLGLIPVTPSNRSRLSRWVAADAAFRDVNWAIDHLHDRDCLERLDRDIRRDYPLVRGDRFLESAFWEKVAQFYYYYGRHYAEHLRASQLAVERGYPAAQLYGKLSELYRIGGRERAAARALGLARRSEIENPWR